MGLPPQPTPTGPAPTGPTPTGPAPTGPSPTGPAPSGPTASGPSAPAAATPAPTAPALPNGIAQATYDEVAGILKRGRNVDQEFDWYQTVTPPIAPSKVLQVDDRIAKWRGITVELAALIIGRTTPDNDDPDDPFVIGQGSTPGGPRLVRYPPGTSGAQNLKAKIRKSIGRNVAYHGALDGSGSVRVQAQGACYEEDADELLNDLVAAIRSDSQSAVEFGLSLAPGLSFFVPETAGAAVRGITALLPDFQSEQVGSDERAIDTGVVEWWRPDTRERWSARKITLHTTPMSQAERDAADDDEQPGWYLLEWIIELGTEARSYASRGMVDEPRMMLDEEQGYALAAAWRVMRGEDQQAVAEELGLAEADVAVAAYKARELGDDEMLAMATLANSVELELLRKKT